MSADEQTKSAAIWPLLPPEPEVPAGNPFAHDRLRRQGEADQLKTLVEHAPTPFVLSLDAEWGTGKTTFVRMWRQLLEDASYKTVYFNAWETDFIADPLVALVGEVGRLLPRSTQAAQAVHKKLKSATSLVVRKATPIAIRLLTAGLFDIKAEDLKGLTIKPEDVEEAFGEAAEKIVEGAIEQYEQHRNEVAEFRKALAKAVDVAGHGKPLIFFVDELDRCRPTFAVELLERIKHLFEVPGVIFVLSVHREQLAHALKAIYGHDFDAEGYLGRFFHISYRLQDPRPEDYARFLVDHVGFTEWRTVTEPLTLLMTHLRLPLRQQQRCVTRAALAMRIVGKGQRNDDPTLHAALLAVREWHPTLYAGLLKGEKSADDVIDALEAVDAGRWNAQQETPPIEASLLIFELDRRQAMRNEDERLPAWRSRRLERYEQETTATVQLDPHARPTRGSRIFEHVRRSMGGESWYFRRGCGQRAVDAVELVGKFQILDERPR